MPSRRWMWVRPTTHIYNYNTDISSFQSSALASSSLAVAAAGSSSSSASCRSMRASSEVVDRSSTARQARATSLAPEAGKSLAGYSGYYGRQLAMMREAEEARRLEAKSSSAQAASMSAATASSSSAAASKSVAATSMKSTTVQAKTTKVEQTTSVQSAKKVSFEAQQRQSLLEGRQSASRAVRRAEHHAETSGKDPRHIGVPRDISDDICKKVADIHMAPFEGREIAAARAALSQGKLKIDRMEKELESITSSAMKYKSIYSKSASQMAKEAMMAAESEAKSSKTVRKTVVESSSRGQVAAA